MANEKNAVTCFLDQGAIFCVDFDQMLQKTPLLFVKHGEPIVIVFMAKGSTRGLSHMQFAVSTLGLWRFANSRVVSVRRNRRKSHVLEYHQ